MWWAAFLGAWFLLLLALADVTAQERPAAGGASPAEVRMQQLEAEMRALTKELAAMREQFKGDGRLAEVDRKIEVLAGELESLRTQLTVPAKKELKSQFGLGPAASSVYQLTQGLSIGGYGEASYRSFFDPDDPPAKVDLTRAVLYFGYKFSDRIVFNSEIEFEHATTGSTVSAGSGEASVEFAALDFFLRPEINARAGLLLVPMGFLNETHEPPFYHGVQRPEVERQIIPSTWRENGFGIFGNLGDKVSYRTYLINSVNAKGFRASDLRNVRQKGNEALAEDFAWVGRLDVKPIPELLLGGSFFLGDTGQDQTFAGRKVDAFTALGSLHAQLRYRGMELRGLGVWGSIDDAEALSADPAIRGPISEEVWGAYGEIAYDLMRLIKPESQQSLTPFYRFERWNTQDDVPRGFVADLRRDVTLNTLGLDYKPHPNVVLKSEFRFFEQERGERSDEFALGIGYVF